MWEPLFPASNKQASVLPEDVGESLFRCWTCARLGPRAVTEPSPIQPDFLELSWQLWEPWCNLPLTSLCNNVAVRRWVISSDLQNPRSHGRWWHGQSPGSVVIINKVCGTDNIIWNDDFWKLQRCRNIFLSKWLGILQGIQKPVQWNPSLAISAVLYHRWGHLDLAKKHYEISLQLDPTASGTKENYGLLRRKLEQKQKKDVWFFSLHCLFVCMRRPINMMWLRLAI